MGAAGAQLGAWAEAPAVTSFCLSASCQTSVLFHCPAEVSTSEFKKDFNVETPQFVL